MLTTGVVKWLAYAAAGWMIIFSLVHVYWALGGSAGLPSGMSIYDNIPLLVIDIVAIPLCLLGAALALALVRPWGRRYSRKFLLLAAWGAAAFMIVHALPAVIDVLIIAFGSSTVDGLTELERFSIFLYEPFWLLGGVIWAFAAWAFQRQTSAVEG